MKYIYTPTDPEWSRIVARMVQKCAAAHRFSGDPLGALAHAVSGMVRIRARVENGDAFLYHRPKASNPGIVSARPPPATSALPPSLPNPTEPAPNGMPYANPPGMG